MKRKSLGSVERAQRRRVVRWLIASLVAVVAVVAAVALVSLQPWGNDDGRGDLTTAAAPLAVLPVQQIAPLPPEAPGPDPAALAAALDPVVNNPALATFTGSVSDAATAAVLWRDDPDRAMLPASTAKILTAAAAMTALPMDHRVSTDVVRGSAPNEIVLVGGGDPTLTAQPIGTENFYPGAARLDDLADQIRRSGVVADTILVDTTAYTGPALADGWFPADIAGGYIAPIEPVMLDAGRIDPLDDESARSGTPALDVGRALAETLGIDPANVRLDAADSGAAPVASVQSAPLRDRLGQMMWRSDNVLAEAIGREVAIATNTDPSFAGATKAVTDTLAAAGMDVAGVHLADASGLSMNDAIPARVLDRVLTAAAGEGQPQLRPMLDYLPVAGATGTLADRYAAGDRAGAGWVRAKTGTLDEASALVGYVVDTDQRVLTFALMSNGSPPDVSRPALDAIAATLRSCGCR
ncbi:MAG TPA: D-alanyl-D-alanine carboxypeptidase/D-alanyl-D-alanine-endopeptidase [Aldersonia sp.]